MSRFNFAGAVRYLALALMGILFAAPVFLLVSGSFMSRWGLGEYLGALESGEGFIRWALFPMYPTFSHYGRLLFETPQFFTVFWNSMKLTVFSAGGQLLLAVPAAWAFAAYRFPFRRFLFTLYVMLMLLPFQVTMLSSYLVLNDLKLVNTHWAIILPAACSTYPVFLIYRGFLNIPRALLDAARIDGAGEWRIFWKIGLPLASNGILSAVVLGFLEYWSLIEQPLAFLENQSLWPLSLYLPEISLQQAGYSFAASVITLIPPAFVFFIGQDYLEKGIAASGMKE